MVQVDYCNIFQMGWNRQIVSHWIIYDDVVVVIIAALNNPPTTSRLQGFLAMDGYMDANWLPPSASEDEEVGDPQPQTNKSWVKDKLPKLKGHHILFIF